ncbi:MAG: hypothetical protein U1E26_01120 [Coriobacteriia bacterium]|nr:hypothetical protein [Coriobacteriia bacterium]
MSSTEIFAIVFALATLVVVTFQLALAFGAPWGALAMGGAFPGRFPPAMRVAAAVQAVILGVAALAILSVAGVYAAPWGATPTWIAWTVAALLGVGLVMNLITPSKGERRIWVPVITVMLVCCIVVAALS